MRRARMVDEAARFAEWTKEGRGDMPPPEEALAKELCELFKSGDIVVSSIVTNATVIPKADLRELWSAVWTDVDVMRQSAGDKPMSSSRRQRYVLWSLLPSALFDVTRDDVPSRSADKRRAAEATSRHRFRADDSDDEVEEIAPVSSRQRKDMDDQGALNPSDLPCMYLSVHVGRRAGRSEHGGMTYGSHWSLAKGLKHVAKNPSSLGSKNLPQLLERAKDTGDLTELDKFVQKTSDSFMTDTTDPFWVTGGSRLLRRWTRGKTVCRTPAPLLGISSCFGRSIQGVGSLTSLITISFVRQRLPPRRRTRCSVASARRPHTPPQLPQVSVGMGAWPRAPRSRRPPAV